jgi:selenocysteine lyase/cysteine desulfurase
METAGLRAAEFGFLDERAEVYLDHTGAGLPPRSLVRGHADRVTRGCFGNPHSESPTSRRSGALLAEARLAVPALDGLGALRHADGSPLVRLYGPSGCDGRGGTVALNVLDAQGHVVDERVVARDSGSRGISLRTGCFCNPGAGEAAFSLDVPLLRSVARRQQARTIDDYVHELGLPSAGAVRVSLGIASNEGDVDAFLAFVADTYRDRLPRTEGLSDRDGC